MGAKTSGNIRPCNVGSVEAHNERTKEYLDGLRRAGKEIYFFPERTSLNTSWVNKDYAGKTCLEIFENMKKLYEAKKGQKPQLKERERFNKKTGRSQKIAGWSPLREMVAVIKEDTKIEDFDYFKRWAEDLGLNVVRIDLHKDEGRLDKNGNFVCNFHAHVVLDFLDKETADTIKLNREKMSELQTILAISLDMERGELKKDTGREHIHHDQYREMMQELNQMTEKIDRRKEEEKKAETRVKGLTTMVANLEKRLSELEKSLQEGNKSLKEENQRLLREIAEVEEKLKEKNELLLNAKQQLQTLNEMAQEKQMTIKKMDRDGLIEKWQKKANAYQDFMFARWKYSREAVNAITERTLNPRASQFSVQQAIAVEKAISETNSKYRQVVANNLMELALPEIYFEKSVVSQKWIDDTAKEVLAIAEGTHRILQGLSQSQDGESLGGGPSYITDLTDWSGRKRK